jgi:hypothetical protein
MLTFWLALATVGLGIVALQLRSRPAPHGDLDALHRMVDALREKQREASLAGEQPQDIEAQIRALLAILPKDDLRRYSG